MGIVVRVDSMVNFIGILDMNWGTIHIVEIM